LSRFIYIWLVIVIVASVLLAVTYSDSLDPYMMQVLAVGVFVIGFACLCISLLLKGVSYWWVSDRLLRSYSSLQRFGYLVMLSATVFMLPFVRSIRDFILVLGAVVIGFLSRRQTA
jgi:hypothetical protein